MNDPFKNKKAALCVYRTRNGGPTIGNTFRRRNPLRTRLIKLYLMRSYHKNFIYAIPFYHFSFQRDVIFPFVFFLTNFLMLLPVFKMIEIRLFSRIRAVALTSSISSPI
jgi:hypothetical protein